MQDFEKWTLDAIRSDGASLSWLEECRFEWTTVAEFAVSQIMEGKTIVLITDRERKWFEQYVLSVLNKSSNDRPIIPIVSIDSVYTHYDEVSGAKMIDMIDDMLSISYKEDYFFWYIGKGEDKRVDIAKRKDNSFLWIFDEDFQNSFVMRSYDSLLDIKLLQLFNLFNLSLSAALFGEVEVE
ncbi:HobA family DNA replication regulator [Sulfurimonas sp. HSL-1716]|uniref:HobA family DNA replication regulator n=1 Tax=Hydrocurvibacter sulfurireducens TaxID=3131937 RepID=UPI0031FA39FD